MKRERRRDFQQTYLRHMAVLLLVVSVGFFASYTLLYHAHIDSIAQTMEEANAQFTRFLTRIVDNTVYGIDSYRIDDRLMRIIERGGEAQAGNDYSDALYVRKVMRDATKMNSYLTGTTLFTADGRIYDNTGKNPAYLDALKNIHVLLDAQADLSAINISGVYRATLHRREMPVLTISQRLINPYQRKVIGYYHLSLDMNQAYGLLTQDNPAASLQSALLSDGQVLYTSDPALAAVLTGSRGEILQKAQAGDALSLMTLQGKYVVAARWMPPYGLVVLHAMPARQYLQSFLLSAVLYLVVLCAFFLVAVVFNTVLSRRVFRPINALIDGMQQLEAGKSVQIAESQGGDMGDLLRQFNHMVRQLEETDRQYRLGVETQRDMQLKLLQSQINPHFIYNTLNLISAMAQLEAKPQISTVALSLSRMLYYNVRAGDETTIRAEMEQVARYISIQYLRFPDKFHYEMDVDPAIMDGLIVKFVMQPLVENAVYHGLEKKAGQGSLWLRGWREGEDAVFVVEDDGIGMDERTYAEVQRLLERYQPVYQQENDLFGIGIYNVHSRIRTYYGPLYGVHIARREQGGTRVTLRIRLHFQKEARP